MEEIKTKKKLNKKPLIICLVLALVFGIVGFMDIKSNATESGKLIEVVSYVSNGTEHVEYSRILNYTEDYELYWYAPSDTYYTGYFECFLYVVSKEHSGLGNDYDHGFVMNGETYYVTILYTSSTTYHDGYKAPRIEGKVVTKVDKGMYHSEFAQNYIAGNIKPDVDFDYRDLVESDDLPIVQNVNFDRIETSEWKNGENLKHIVDYLRFNSNPDYKLMIMLCPTIYSTYGSKNYVADFEKYEYPQWIYMCIADENLKEISCDVGTFKMPTESVSDIKMSDYYLYYEEILNSLGNGAFKPTMAYRLAYVDVENGLVGPSTYIKPLSYNNLTPDTESYSYFTLYTDGTRNTEKIMNLKTWSVEYDASTGEVPKDLDEVIQDMKDTVVNVGDYLKDKIVVDNDVDVQEATNWLYSVVSFIKGTPSMVGSVLSFLPQPILYGMYITIFLGCIASAVAIVKALI